MKQGIETQWMRGTTTFSLPVLFLLACLAVFVAPAIILAETVTVETSGVGFIRDGNIALARDMAINDALLRAVEQGVGVGVESRTIIINTLLAEDRLTTTVRGMVQRYEVLSEQREGNGLYRVNVRATVDKKEVAETLQQAAGNHRILLISPKEEQPGANPGLDQAIHAFVQAGFSLARLRMEKDDFDLLDKKTITRLTKKHHADLVLTVTMETDGGQCPAPGLCAAYARGRMALWTGTSGAELARAVVEQVRGFGNTPELARQDGLRRAGERLGTELTEQLFHPPEIDLKIMVRHLPDQKTYNQFLARLATLRWLRSVRPDHLGFHPGRSVFLVRFAGSPDLLGEMLTRIPDCSYQGRTNQTLKLEYIK